MIIISFVKKYILTRKGKFAFYIICSFLISAITIFIAYCTGKFFDFLTGAHSGNLVVFCLLIAILNIGSLVLQYCGKMSYVKLNFDIVYEISRDIIDIIHNASLLQSPKSDAAYLNKCINHDTDSIVDFVISTITSSIVNILSIFLILVLMIKISTWITFTLCCFFVIYLFLYIIFKKPLFKYGYEMKEQQSHCFSKMFEQINLVSFIKLHAVEKLFKKRLLQAFQFYRKSLLRYQRTAFIFSSLDGTVMVLMQIFLFITCGITIMNGNMSAGGFIILSSFANRLISSASYFFGLGKSYQNAYASYERIQNILSWEKDLNKKRKLNERILEINMKDVCFSFGDKSVMKDLVLNFKRGSKYAVIGENGSGKTTFIHLLVGIYRPESGIVTYNGLPVSQLDVKYLRKNKIGIVEQEPVLLQDSIYNNICLDAENSDDVKLKAIIDILDLSSFIEKQPYGIHTLISAKNNNISGGEKQKIAIARLLLKEPEVMIFDEPTSALDQQTTVRLVGYLNKIKREKIIIIITHTQSIIDVCENVIYMDNSKFIDYCKINE